MDTFSTQDDLLSRFLAITVALQLLLPMLAPHGIGERSASVNKVPAFSNITAPTH